MLETQFEPKRFNPRNGCEPGEVKISNPEELDVLMTAEEYEEYVEKEAGE